MRFVGPPLSTFKNPRAVAAAILTLGGLTTYAVNFPGSLSFDSYVQLLEGREASYSNWHPAIMSWLLGIADALRPGAAYFVLFDTVLAFAALVSLLWVPRRVSWVAVIAAVIVVCLPQLILYQGIVWKDVLFADATLAGFVCLAHAAARWSSKRVRLAALGAALLFVVLATLTRQNGAIVLLCAAVTMGAIAAHQEKRWRSGVAYGAAFLAAGAVAAFAVDAALQLRSDGTHSTAAQFKLLRLYDTVGMMKAHPDLPLAVLDEKSPALAKSIRSDGVRLFSPERNDTLVASAPLQQALEATPAPVLTQQWLKLMLRNPADYLALRGELFRWVFAAPDGGQCHPYFVGADGDPADMAALGMRPRHDRRDAMLDRYARAFVGTPVFAHPAFGLVAFVALVLLLRRRRPADLAVAGLLVAVLLFALSFFVISIACDYRYLYVLDLSAIAAALYLSADWSTTKWFSSQD
jgi:hypothetical protein